MTEDYLKNTAEQLNKTFQLYKAKLKDLPKKAETDTERDKVADWFGNTLNEFIALANTVSDKDVANFVSHFATACLNDLEDKYTNTSRHTEYRWLGNIDDIESFIESCKKGDSVRYKGVEIEVRRVD